MIEGGAGGGGGSKSVTHTHTHTHTHHTRSKRPWLNNSDSLTSLPYPGPTWGTPPWLSFFSNLINDRYQLLPFFALLLPEDDSDLRLSRCRLLLLLSLLLLSWLLSRRRFLSSRSFGRLSRGGSTFSKANARYSPAISHSSADNVPTCLALLFFSIYFLATSYWPSSPVNCLSLGAGYFYSLQWKQF